MRWLYLIKTFICFTSLASFFTDQLSILTHLNRDEDINGIMILNCQVFSQHLFCTRNKSILTCKNNISLFQLSFYKSCLLQVDRVVLSGMKSHGDVRVWKMHLYSNVDITNRRIIGELKIILMYIWKLNDKNMIILTETSSSRLLKPTVCKKLKHCVKSFITNQLYQ